MARNGNSKPTKELILDAAFSFLNEMHYNTFSMNELAAKVGISKPAIYRHFKNKEDVLNAMENRVIMGSAPFLKKISSGDSSVVKNALSGLIQHFIENTTHINFFIASMSSMPNYEERLYTSLYDNEVSFLKNESYFKKFAEDMGLFSRHVFCGMSIFFFVKVMERMRCEGKLTEIPPQFSDKIVSLLYGGLRGNTEESNMLHPEPISDERKKELVALCEIKPEVFPEENRIFTALAAVIEKYTMTGVTVERIADELHMAKSSLYEYFDNKSEMIRTLVTKELSLLRTIIIENSVEAKTFTEYIVILMLSELEYFTHRPSIIPICGWLLMDDHAMKDENSEEEHHDALPWEARLPDRIDSPDLGFPYLVEVITEWIKCLPVAFLIEAKGKNLSKEKRMEGFMLTIDYILNGVN